MEVVKLNNFIKNKLLRKPINIRSIKKSADNYQSVLDLFKKFKTDGKWFDYEICGIFDCFHHRYRICEQASILSVIDAVLRVKCPKYSVEHDFSTYLHHTAGYDQYIVIIKQYSVVSLLSIFHDISFFSSFNGNM